MKKDGGGSNIPAPNETATQVNMHSLKNENGVRAFKLTFIFFPQTRDRLAAALQNRDLLRSIGEYEEFQPVDARHVREIRAIFECLGGYGFQLGPARKKEPPSLTSMIGIPPNKVVRTEKVS